MSTMPNFMGSKARSCLLLLMFVVGLSAGSRFQTLMITTSRSTYSNADSLVGSVLGPICSCGAHTVCSLVNGTNSCDCRPGYVGQPPECQVGPELWALCYRDTPCGPNASCYSNNGTRVCLCHGGFVGDPPHCQPEPHLEGT